jgi:hypothetical protein
MVSFRAAGARESHEVDRGQVESEWLITEFGLLEADLAQAVVLIETAWVYLTWQRV